MCLKMFVNFNARARGGNTSSKSCQRQEEFDHGAERSRMALGGERRGPCHPHIWGQAGNLCPDQDIQKVQGDLEFSSKIPSWYKAGSAAAL